jgi:hypothetical protein
MPIGPGKYDDICSKIRQEVNAKGVVLLILGGDKGDGFSCQAEKHLLECLRLCLEQSAEAMKQDIGQIEEEA